MFIVSYFVHGVLFFFFNKRQYDPRQMYVKYFPNKRDIVLYIILTDPRLYLSNAYKIKVEIFYVYILYILFNISSVY